MSTSTIHALLPLAAGSAHKHLNVVSVLVAVVVVAVVLGLTMGLQRRRRQ